MTGTAGNIGGIVVGLLIAVFGAALMYMARTGTPRSWRDLEGNRKQPTGNIRNAKQAVRAGAIVFVLGLGCVAVAITKLS